jgi:putative intracellular protease/amidase
VLPQVANYAVNQRFRAGSGLAIQGPARDNASMTTKIKLLLLLCMASVGIAYCQQGTDHISTPAERLAASAKGRIRVAFVLTQHAVMIDFAGPWEVFQDVMVPSRGADIDSQHVFDLYTVSDSKQPIRVSGGMQVIPDYTFDDAPQPKVVVIPAQMGDSPKMIEWIRKMATQSDVVMSVCTGAFKLAETGLLKGKKATTHHGAYVRFQNEFPEILVQKDVRYVQSDSVIFTSGGLSAGIDLALHIVELYFGRAVAASTARTMEYEGSGWTGNGTARVKYSEPDRVSSPADRYTQGVLGNWDGKIITKDGAFRVAVHIWPDKDGELTGTLDSVDEDENEIAINSITLHKSDLHFEIATLSGAYAGKLDSQESRIEGTWTQHGASAPLTLTRKK